jgi:hypothetical protein
MNMAADNDYRTVLVLMKGTDADATIDALEASGQNINVKDEGPYWKLRSNEDIYVDMEAVEEELGTPITLAKWLVTMTSFVGYADTGETHFAVRVDRGDAVKQNN